VNLCLYDRDGTVEFVEDARMLGGVLADYHPAHLEYAKSTLSLPEDADGHPRTVVKPARTIRGLLRELHAPEVIDYWSLDTEGSELRLLKAFPFESYACRVITVEHNHLPDRDRIRRFLLERGYALARTLAIDDCYVARSGELRPAWRSRAWGGALGTVRLRAGRS